MKTDKITGFVLLFFSLFMLFFAFQIKEMTSIKGISSRFWPLCILCCIVILSLILIIKGDNSYSFPWRKFIGCLIFFIGYIFALQFIGYIPATFFFQLLFLGFLGIQSRRKILFFSTVTTVILTIVFRFLLNVLLPVGVGIFRNFNIFLMG